jgi:Ricin-type beta-trefoil lectin domain
MTGMVGLFEALETNGTSTSTSTGPVRSGISGKCLDVRAGSTADGSAVQLFDCNGSAAQNWTASSNNTLQVSGKCLDATAYGTANGTPLEIWDCNGGSNQQWVAANGGYKNPASGRCIDDLNFATANGTQLALWDCNGGVNQVWSQPGK